MQNQHITKILTNTTANAQQQKLVTASSTATISDGLKQLSSHRIHSLPISDNSGKWTAFLDLSDIVDHMFTAFTDDELKHIPKVMEFQGEYLKVLDKKDKLWEVDDSQVPDPSKVSQFRSKSAGEVARHEFHALQEGCTLLDVAQLLVKQPKLRRIPIVDKSNQLKAIVTPMDIIQLLVSKDLGAAGQLKVKDLHLESSKTEVIKISKNATALEGFKLITSKNITGIAVVDQQDKLVGNLSNSDLKAIMYDAREYINLYLPISDYLQKVRQKDSMTPLSGISVHADSTVNDLLKCFASKRIHRIFVVANDNTLTGVITLCDFLEAALNNGL